MHRRGDVPGPDGESRTRGSVWVEQEIAIAAFMQHVLNRSIPVLFYKQAGVGIEGIRSVLLMNPRVEFTDDAQVLDDLRSALPTVQFNPFTADDLVPVLSHRRMRDDGDRHTYMLTADVKNVGSVRVTDFEMRVFFPRAFLDPGVSWGAADQKKATKSHICFIANEGRAPRGLYPGDTATNPLTIEYFVNHDLDDDPQAMQSEIIIELFSGPMTPKKRTFLIRDFPGVLNPEFSGVTSG